MEQYAGIDVSLDSASICVVDASGRILREAKVASDPEAFLPQLGTEEPDSALRARTALASTLIAGLELARDDVLVLEQDAAWTPVRVRRHAERPSDLSR